MRLAVGALALCACAEVSEREVLALTSPLRAAPRTWATASPIPAYAAPVMATVHGKLTLFGASDELQHTGTLDTWEWYAGAWARRKPESAPSDRILPGLAPYGDTLVMFGGFQRNLDGELSVLGETWQWNGRAWTELQPRYGAVPRYQPGLANICKKLIMFGGQLSDTLNDTWIYNGTWTQQSIADPPQGCTSPVASLGTTAVMFCSGTQPDDHYGHTYEWNGDRWIEKLTATRPSRRYAHQLARYDDRVVMYGGFADSGNWQETWEWDGADWHDVSVLPSPPPREGYQLQQQADELVLFGGGESTTWTWNGAAWNIAAQASMPAQRQDYAIATLDERAILFGGCCKRGGAGAPAYWDDTWAWDGSSWRELSPAQRPPARTGAALAAVGGKLVLFGGLGADGLLADTWLFDGATWTEVTTTSQPPARQMHTMAGWNGNAYVFGGSSQRSPRRDGILSDMWTWDGSQWRQEMFGTQPGGGYGSALASFGAQLALFEQEHSRLWYWDGSNWSLAGELPSPPFVSTRSALVELPLSASESHLVLAGDRDGIFGSLEWDGTSWTNGDIVYSGLLGPMAAQGSTLVSLAGWPLRTWTYASR